MAPDVSLKNLKADLRSCANQEKAKVLQRFFKTGPGGYAAGDIFLGITVPVSRALSKHYQTLGLPDVVKLLKSPIHEERLVSLLILMVQYRQADLSTKEKIYKIYLLHSKYINNWDLVDLSAEHIVGNFLLDRKRAPLYGLAHSRSVWERRIAILSTFCFIKNDDFKDTLQIARILIADQHDLIHKAVGWMLREIGKRDQNCEEKFLRKFYPKMPRTMLRYAIERFPKSKREAYLRGVV